MNVSFSGKNGSGSTMARIQHRVERGDMINPVRLALYSHDGMGVGHVRRNLLIAQRLSEPPINGTSLVICGIHEATAFSGGHGIGCLTLPSFEKHAHNDYRPRDLRLTRDVVSSIRTESLRSSMMAMSPDVLVVDKVPRGLHGELESVLPELRRNGTRLVFGMRDVLDCPDRIEREWREAGFEEFIRQNYDAVWIYGDPGVFDPIDAYGFASLRGMARYTGYFDQRERLRFTMPFDRLTRASFGDLGNTVMCMVGGGQDGFELAMAFAKARFPDGRQGLLITGPLMPNDQHCAILAAAADREDLRIVRQVRDADLLMTEVAKVICMGGYNSMLSVVSFAKPGLIVPRVQPREEQRIRAQRFEELGLLEMLLPEHLSPGALSKWMANDHCEVKGINEMPQHESFDLGGLNRVPELVSELLSTNHSRSHPSFRMELP